MHVENALLAGDIGGTKTSLAIFTVAHGRLEKKLAQKTFPSHQYPGLDTLANEFLAGIDFPVQRASFGVAGPVVDGKARITNLPWQMEEEQLATALKVPSVSLLNDLEAIAYSVPHLGPEDVLTLNTGESVVNGGLAVIAPGTGLGEAFLSWNGLEPDERGRGHYLVHASEGGHADFAPTNELQIELLRYLLAREDHVSYERICSGLGLPNIYTFLRDTGRFAEPAWLTEKLATATDLTPVIVQAALGDAPDADICRETVRIFVAVLGAEAGNLALKVMATGGIYLGGGIPPRIVSFLEEDRFLQAFLGKGRFADLLRPIPVHVILHPEVALLGAAYHAVDALQAPTSDLPT